ncbi:hypothetical protein ACFYU8_18340 [Brevibacillus sp. NPDC003359]|uniref:hypothetical protein n=1 Tax=unclassified Brevibacillus TaxID=2684853 RepID=UPI0036AE58E3
MANGMNLLIQRPTVLTSEWVFTSKDGPDQMAQKLVSHGYTKAAEGFIRSVEGRSFTIYWNRRDPSSNGQYLYYAHYNGDPTHGVTSFEAMCSKLRFCKRSFSIYLPVIRKGTALKILGLGFQEKMESTSARARCYELDGISLFQFDDGVVLQTRTRFKKQWKCLQKKTIWILENMKNLTGIEKAV